MPLQLLYDISCAMNATLIPCRRLSIQDFRGSFGEPLQCKRGVTEVERGLGKQPVMKCTWYSSGKEFARVIVMEVFEVGVKVIVGVIIEEHLELQGLMLLMIAVVLELHSFYYIFLKFKDHAENIFSCSIKLFQAADNFAKQDVRRICDFMA